MKIAATFDQETFFRTTVGFLQGLLLLLIYELLDNKLWPTGQVGWIVAWYAVVLSVPTAIALNAQHFRDPRLWRFALCLAAVIGVLSFYTGWTVPDEKSYSAETIFVAFGATFLLGWFVTLPFAQSWLETKKTDFPYPALFQHSWGNLLALKVAAFYTCTFWGLLGLWAALFKLIGIDFFAELFTKRPFIYLVTGTAFGFALSFGASNGKLITGLRNMLMLVFQSLLPLASFIAVIFLAALPFTGLKPLWDTNHATLLMLNSQLYMILFFNAVYQDGAAKPPKNPVVRAVIEAGIALLPVYTGLCVYALALRIDQYGWSMSRIYACLATLIVGLYAAGYCASVLRREKPWMKSAGRINVLVAAVVVALTVLVNTPLLDPKGISARSQTARLLAGDVAPEKFDFNYLRFDLGKAGYEATVRLSNLSGHPKAEVIREKAQGALAKQARWSNDAAEITSEELLARRLKLYPKTKTLDPEFLKFLMATKKDYGYCLTHNDEGNLLLAVDLNRDGRDEMVLFCGYALSVVFERDKEGWRRAGNLNRGTKGPTLKAGEMENILSQGDFQVVENEWESLKLGQQTYQVVDRAD